MKAFIKRIELLLLLLQYLIWEARRLAREHQHGNHKACFGLSARCLRMDNVTWRAISHSRYALSDPRHAMPHHISEKGAMQRYDKRPVQYRFKSRGAQVSKDMGTPTELKVYLAKQCLTTPVKRVRL